MIRLLISLILVLILTSSAFGASAEVWGQKFVEITWSAAITDWVCSRDIIPVRAFFTATAAADVFVLRENSVTGPRIVKQTFSANWPLTQSFDLFGTRDETWKPCVKAADQTWTTLANAVLVIEFK